jgi:hypothetical protein
MKTEAPPLTIAYVTKGFWDEVRTNKLVDKISEVTQNISELTLVDDVTTLANLVEQVWEEDYENSDFCGVWEYEITEPFGSWLASLLAINKELPSFSDCLAHIRWLAVGANTQVST